MRGRAVGVASILALAAAAGGGELAVTPLVGDHMVVQRGRPLPVWGTADAGASVTVTFAGDTVTGRADAGGRWRVDLPARAAGGPHRLTIRAGAEHLDVTDVLVGDLWLCSGQSNIEWTVADSLDAEAVVAAADEPAIRHFKVPRSWSTAPERDLAGGSWEVAAPATAAGFTAVGYFFARALRRDVDVPVGLINSTWGGSRIEAWMAAGALGLDPGWGERALVAEAAAERAVLARLAARTGGLPERDPGMAGGRAVWADPGLDDAAWPTIPVPGPWETAGWEGMDGIAWYRTAFDLTAAEAAAGIRLGLGAIDDSDITWVNGREVGRTESAWNRARIYDVAAEHLVAGRNVLAVRVEDTGGGGGFHGDPAALFVDTGGRRIPLAGTWSFAVGEARINLDDRKRDVPTMLYNAMIHPLLPVPITGVLWYQGESNTGSAAEAGDYRRLFQTLIGDWRRGWQAPRMPFLFAQLAAFLPPAEQPADSTWALLRESQAAALDLPRTAQAVLIDAGDADDVHPRDKRVVGERLALAARAVAYGHELVYSGPRYAGHAVEGGRIVVRFDHAGGGLEARGGDGRLHGFAVAGADRRFAWAEAVIEGDRILVSSPAVPRPVAVRYAWADNPAGANLYNREGLPASPFRTDTWPPADAAADSPEP